MKKKYSLLHRLMLGFLALACAMAAEANPFQDGNVISLQGDTGKWFARCAGCQNTVDRNRLRDTVTLHVDNPGAGYARFTVVDMHNGKIALRSDTGKYVARCQGCVSGAAYPNMATVHVDDPNAGYAQFRPVPLQNGRYALQADTGGYLTRCNNCSPGAAYRDTVTMHVTDPNAAYAQWRVQIWSYGQAPAPAQPSLPRQPVAPVAPQPPTQTACNGWRSHGIYSIPGTTGRNLHMLSFIGLNGSKDPRYFDGYFRQVGCQQWAELGPHKAVRFNFDEVGRDDWSVYLLDRSRNVNIQLDVHRKRVVYSQGNGPRSDLYQIENASHLD